MVAWLCRPHPVDLREIDHHERISRSGRPRACDSRGSGSAREELHAPKGVGMFAWLLGKQSPPWEPTSLQKELEGGQNNSGEKQQPAGWASCL